MKTIPLALALTTAAAFSQGPLAPSAAPAPTMKTLDQIEARTPIPASPAVPVAGPHFTITQPGSYYLTGNVKVTSGDGIEIAASNVTLDLNGFALISTAVVNPGSGSAINLVSGISSIVIKNGRITGGTVRTLVGPQDWNATFAKAGWYRGIQDSNAVDNTGLLISHLTIEKCSVGIYLFGKGACLDHVTATGNGFEGINASGASVTNSTATTNGSTGIFAFQGSVTNCTAHFNVGTGISANVGSVSNSAASVNGSHGISAPSGSITNANASGNNADGINAIGASVTNSHATNNFKNGIEVGAGVVAYCVASGNSTDFSTVDKQIEVSSSPSGQRIGCVPATE